MIPVLYVAGVRVRVILGVVISKIEIWRETSKTTKTMSGRRAATTNVGKANKLKALQDLENAKKTGGRAQQYEVGVSPF